jgi:uncharacterized protein YndB with AHSA1/START domain
MIPSKPAPVITSGEIEIAALPETVWSIMTAIKRWPEWNPEVKQAFMEGSFIPGTTFRWKAGPGIITSVIREVEPPRILSWTGKTLGIHAVHVWRLTSRGSGTIVRTEESWDGLLPMLFRHSLRRTLQKSIDMGLGYLKIEAERRVNTASQSSFPANQLS